MLSGSSSKAQTAERPMPGQSPPAAADPAQLMGMRLANASSLTRARHSITRSSILRRAISDFQAVCNIVKTLRCGNKA
ncbi:hypothetical protein PO124_23840 [Bacillus licheniformis]|nr:hypothetical protein [Bacillus licheniformis]